MTTVKFEINDNYLVGKSDDFEFRKKVAMFDLDHTLIEPKSGKKLPIDVDDWKFLYKNINEKLTEYYEDNYSIIIITNQSKINDKDIIKKITNICKKLENIELCVFVATKKNKFRKPSPAFYYDFIIEDNDPSNKSFYCGDAAGRKGDHSDCDYKFALNCDIKFNLPEQIFGKEKKVILPEIKYPDLQYEYSKILFKPQKTKEIVIMIGMPGSGKSTIAKEINEKYNYEIINRDTLKTVAKCQKMAKELVQKDESFVVDNTNPNSNTREFYIKLANDNDYYITCIWVTTSLELSMHMNYYRNINNNASSPIPDIAYRIYKKNFIEPSKKEGFDNIIKQSICFDMKKLNKYFYWYLH